MLSKTDIEQARKRISGYLNETPLLTSVTLNKMCGASLYFKCENFQKSGSFKYRGVANALLSLSEKDRQKGVITHSSGNHGAALAAFSSKLSLHCTVVVPETTSEFKFSAIQRYGAHIVKCGNSLESRELAVKDLIEQKDMTFIPPYDHLDVISGQGTLGLEVMEELEAVEEIWLPVGGGGLAGGNVLSVGDSAQVVGAEPLLASDAHESLRMGIRQPQMEPKTCADGLRTALGELNFEILSKYSLPIHLVDEAEIKDAQAILMSCLKILVEPSAAVAFAALLKNGPHHSQSKVICLVVSGGNVKS